MDPSRHVPHRLTQLTHEYSLFAPADVTAPRLCRDFVRAVLFTHDREDLVMPAALCTSELVTNVHLHTKGTAMLRIRLTPTRFRVGVFDESPDPPVVAHPAGTVVACWGRGLALVQEMADKWGVADERAGRFAKGVWFELDGGSGGNVPALLERVNQGHLGWSAPTPSLP
ncbi:ATP-binding protein [Streptomyces caeruleatus]|uniref:ATP-binding protein n=1 Tax=Streptomyces caeruleatus TaxID=661399 RepID=UPI000AE5C896|nr:ATP-binding protein [Streptomyces caeruleatus]